MRTRIIWATTGVVLLVAGGAFAAWLVNGNAVCTATGVQDNVSMAANGRGGAMMVWQDNRGASQDIYAQQIDGYGVNEWAANGVAVCTATGLQQTPRVVHDNWWNFYYTWQDYRNGNADIYLAMIDWGGTVFTPADGLALCTATGDQTSPSLAVYNPTGTTFAAWGDTRSGNSDIYFGAFRVSTGVTTPANGAPVCTLPSVAEWPAVAARWGGHSVVAWQDFRNGNADVYAQGMGFTGVAQWAANGVPVCTAAGAQLDVMAIDVDLNGTIIAWRDFRNGTFTQAIYAQRIDTGGNPQWAANGVLVAQSTDLINLPKMIPDGSGGAIIAWGDDRNIGTTGADIYAQRIDVNGNRLWGANGTAVCNAPFNQANVDLALGPFGLAVVTWFDGRTLGPTDIYAQSLEPSAGIPLWTTDGNLVCSAIGNQFNPDIVADGTGGVIMGWEDRRNGSSNADIYAVRLHGYTGELGHPEPTIVSVTDVPGDNGGFVTVQWQPGYPADAAFYQIYRGTSPGNLTDMVANEVADGSSTYNTVVATTGDGVDNFFMVFLYTYVPWEYNSNIAAGQSADNATPVGDTPGMPAALALRPNSPNPFSASTELHVGLPREANVHLEVYDVAGRRVFAREVGRMSAGWQSLLFDGRGDGGQPLASGVYFYRVTAGGEATTRKMVIGR